LASISVIVFGLFGTLKLWRLPIPGTLNTLNLPPQLLKLAEGGVPQHLVADAAFVLATLFYCSIVSRTYLAAPKSVIQVRHYR
jgi:hypothetical protein